MSEIRCLVLDVDGVLTDARLLYGGSEEPIRAFHVQDGFAIAWFQRLGGVVAIITGKTSRAVESRAADLGIRHVVQGSENKAADLRKLLETLEIEPKHVAVIGDDLNDLPAMQICGYPIAVADAAGEVKAAARFVTGNTGGHGAVREAIEHLLRADGRWEEIIAHYRAQAALGTHT